MKLIPLTQGKFAIVDDNKYDWLMQWSWQCHKQGRTFRAVRTGRPPEVPKQRTISMHRQIMKAKAGQEIDHRNRNELDNRICNLRFCTHYQNMANSRKIRNRSSKYKGVSWRKDAKKWVARIKFTYKSFFLGYFVSEITAAKAYDTAARKYFGEFANLNFPNWKEPQNTKVRTYNIGI